MFSSNIDSRETDTLSFVVYVDKITKEYVQDLKSIKQIVKTDLIKSKKGEIAKKQVSNITDKFEKAVQELAKIKGVKTFAISKKEILLNQKKNLTTLSEIKKHIPSQNVLFDIVSTLKKGEAKYFLLPNGDYLVIGIKQVNKGNITDITFLKIIEKYMDTTIKRDFNNIAINAFKHQLQIKIDNKALDRITRSIDKEEDNR
jgi:hypothetical protein